MAQPTGERAAPPPGTVARRWLADPLLLVILVGGLLVTALMTAAAAAVYDAVAEADGVVALDPAALDAAIGLRTPLGDRLVSAYTHLGGTVGLPLLAVAVAVAMAVRWRRWTPPLLVLVTGLGSLVLTTVGKAVVARQRPPAVDALPPFETSYSFPSGHSLNSMAIAGIVAYLVIRHLRRRAARVATLLIAIAYAVGIGLSRVYLGQHWLTDVLVAWALALAWLSVVITVHLLFLRRRGNADVPAPAT